MLLYIFCCLWNNPTKAKILIHAPPWCTRKMALKNPNTTLFYITFFLILLSLTVELNKMLRQKVVLFLNFKKKLVHIYHRFNVLNKLKAYVTAL